MSSRRKKHPEKEQSKSMSFHRELKNHDARLAVTELHQEPRSKEERHFPPPLSVQEQRWSNAIPDLVSVK